MRDRKQIRETIEGVTAETGGWIRRRRGARLATCSRRSSPPRRPPRRRGGAGEFSEADKKEIAAAGCAAMDCTAPTEHPQHMQAAIADVDAVLAGNLKGVEDRFIEGARAAMDAIRARRKPAPTSDERPMLTEWRLHENTSRLMVRFVVGDEGPLRHVAGSTASGWAVFPEPGSDREIASGPGGTDECDAWIRANPMRAPGRLPAPAPVPGDAASAPINMILNCPRCGRRHIDAPEPGTGWTNPPHKSHLCHGCGLVWRPADVPTNGVLSIATKGDRDTFDPTEHLMASACNCFRGCGGIDDWHRHADGLCPVPSHEKRPVYFADHYNVITDSYPKSPAPDALRERAIRAVAARLDDEAAQILQRVEAGGREDELIEAIGERLERFTVAAVERALRDEREAAYQRGRADAAKTREEPAPLLDEATRMEIAQRLTLAMHIYAGHKIDSRGPTGCIYEALQLAAPAVAADLDETMDYSATYARFWEDGQLRPGKRSGAVPSPREEAPAWVLAVVEGVPVVERGSLPGKLRAVRSEVIVPADAPDRVTVAVLTGPIAGIVEAHRAREAWKHHQERCDGGCEHWPDSGEPHPGRQCPDGQRLAAAVKPIK